MMLIGSRAGRHLHARTARDRWTSDPESRVVPAAGNLTETLALRNTQTRTYTSTQIHVHTNARMHTHRGEKKKPQTQVNTRALGHP